MPDNVLVTLCNDNTNYIQAAMALFYSAKKYGNWQGKYLLLGYKLSEDTRKIFEDRGVKVYNILEDVFKSKRRSARQDLFSRVVYCKYHLFSNLFEEYGKIVFFDSDCMVLNDISPLLDIKGFGSCFYKSFDFTFKERKGCYGTNNHTKEYRELLENYNSKEKLCGAGILVLDRTLAMNENFEELKELTRHYGHLSSLPEESIINLFALKRDHECLPYSYDHVIMNGAKANILTKAVHLLVPKPWDVNCSYHERFKENVQGFFTKFKSSGAFTKIKGFTKL